MMISRSLDARSWSMLARVRLQERQIILLVLRVILLLYVVAALHGKWLLEQPKGSDGIITKHPRMQQFMNERVRVPCPVSLDKPHFMCSASSV